MKKQSIIMALVLSISLSSFAQKTTVSTIEFTYNMENSYKANLSEGKFLEDLSWAWNSSVACFPETQKHKFTGKHVFFTGIMPNNCEVTITIIPKNKKSNLSLYAYQISENDEHLVPDLSSCIACEAEHKWDYKKRGKTQDHTRTIGPFTAIRNSYRIVIGVVGADGLDEGEFTIIVKTIKR